MLQSVFVIVAVVANTRVLAARAGLNESGSEIIFIF